MPVGWWLGGMVHWLSLMPLVPGEHEREGKSRLAGARGRF